MLKLPLRVLDRLEEILIASLMAAATLITFAAVVHRYLSTVPLLQDYVTAIDMTWSEELSVYMFIWVAKFGAAYGVRTGIHVGVDVLIKRLPPGSRRWVILFALLSGALFTAIIGTIGAQLVWDLDPDQGSPDMDAPMWIVYLAIPCGSYLMCFRFLQVAWRFARSGELPSHEPGRVEGITPLSSEGAGG
jgi:C4-dicarboxylate transporter DctQ subunit